MLSDFDTLYTSGHQALQKKDFAKALEDFKQALALQPDNFRIYMSLGDTLTAANNHTEALTYFQQALQLNPNNPHIYLALSRSLAHTDQLEQAIQCLESTLRFNHQVVDIYYQLGHFYHQTRNYPQTAHYYQKVLSIHPQHSLTWRYFGRLYTALWRHGEAQKCFERYTCIEQGYPLNWGSSPLPELVPLEKPLKVTRHKLEHDLEQLSYLIEQGLLPEYFSNLIEYYQVIIADLVRENKYFRVYFEGQTKEILMNSYGRNLYLDQSMDYSQPVLHPGLDSSAIEKAYLNREPHLVFFDHLLSDGALETLRNFCLRSTIWHDDRKAGRYLGAYQAEGFNHPILYTIAEELMKKFPTIFKGLHLAQAWAFKYDSQYAEGINVHADSAKVNLNFWITPDEANLDLESGGLILYAKEAPLEWDFEVYNSDKEKIDDFLSTHQPEKIIIPHRCNRAVMFNSNLFHGTDNIHFKPGYTNRRINITMLFGYRHPTSAV